MMLADGVTDQKVNQIIEKQEGMSDWLSIAQHHDALPGTDRAYVNMDYETNLAHAFEPSLFLNLTR